MRKSVLEQIQGGLIVSCQASETEPLYGSDMMARMALAAQEGGAIGIRANGPEDIREIKQVLSLPVIGIFKREYKGYGVYITPTLNEVDEVVGAGADILAMDATDRIRPNGLTTTEFIQQIKTRYPDLPVMADVSIYEEGVLAEQAGADLVASTMSGYTDYSPAQSGPDFGLIKKLANTLHVPVIAEGRVQSPDQAKRCIDLGAWAVVVGSAITRPQEITRAFAECMRYSSEHSPLLRA